MSTQLPPPTNALTDVIDKIIDILIKGLGADIAYGVLVAKFPVAGFPVIRVFTRGILDRIALYFNTNGKRIADIMAIRWQNDARKDEYDKILKPIQEKENPTDAEIQAAKDAIDRLVNRNK